MVANYNFAISALVPPRTNPAIGTSVVLANPCGMTQVIGGGESRVSASEQSNQFLLAAEYTA